MRSHDRPCTCPSVPYARPPCAGPGAASAGDGIPNDVPRGALAAIHGGMRLTRSRLLLRVVLLSVSGAVLLVRAETARRASAAQPAGAFATPGWSVLWGVLGVLALVTAATSAMALRARPLRKGLGLRSADPPPPKPPPDQ